MKTTTTVAFTTERGDPKYTLVSGLIEIKNIVTDGFCSANLTDTYLFLRIFFCAEGMALSSPRQCTRAGQGGTLKSGDLSSFSKSSSGLRHLPDIGEISSGLSRLPAIGE